MTRLVRPSFLSLLLLVVVVPTPLELVAQFQVVEPLTDHGHREIFELIYSSTADELNDAFELPGVVQLTSDVCEEANAFYEPADQENDARIILCTELVDEMILRRRRAQAIIVAQLRFVFLHEAAHAMVDVLDLPILGQEEEAADRLATLFFSSQDPLLAMWAADFWRQGGTGASFGSMEAFADEHDLDQERFFDIMCWTYGADPFARAFVVELSGVPLQRAQPCQGEYDRLRSSLEPLLSGHLKNPLAFEDLDPVRNASGYWRFMESMMDDEHQVRCSAAGTLGLWQMDTELAGSITQNGSCVFFGAPVGNAAEADISVGGVTESGLSFEVANCRYEGIFEDESRMSLGGSVTCTGVVGGGVPDLKGTWRAVR